MYIDKNVAFKRIEGQESEREKKVGVVWYSAATNNNLPAIPIKKRLDKSIPFYIVTGEHTSNRNPC